jgi:NAD+ diphosphatase
VTSLDPAEARRPAPLALDASVLDAAAWGAAYERRFRAGAAGDPSSDPLVFAFVGERLVLTERGGALPASLAPFEVACSSTFGALDGRPAVFATLAREAGLPEGHRAVSLRGALFGLDAVLAQVGGLAAQLESFTRTHRFCGACGEATSPREGERALACVGCALTFYPRVHPAVIVLVVDDAGRVLMTRQASFPPGMYGLVAGFVEPGETLEACVRREVLEETGLEVSDVRYFGSQPWPFPHQVMIAFSARVAGGVLSVDHAELEEAAFFARDALPVLPPPLSIARYLVDAWLAATEVTR